MGRISDGAVFSPSKNEDREEPDPRWKSVYAKIFEERWASVGLVKVFQIELEADGEPIVSKFHVWEGELRYQTNTYSWILDKMVSNIDKKLGNA